MQPFTHPYAKSARVIFKKMPGGGYVSDTLVVVPSIPVDPTDPAFDAAKLDELEVAAVMYGKARGSVYDHIVFEEA